MDFKPSPEIVWEPTKALVSESQVTKFIEVSGVENYDMLLLRADQDPGWFWGAVIKFMDVKFYNDYSAIMDSAKGIEWTEWCVGGKTNIVLNCLDKHKGSEVWSKPYIHHEAENGITRLLSYAELDKNVCQLAEGLRALGIGKGDAVGLYMPMIPEVVIAFFAIIKIGGVVIPLFSGFGPEPIITRLNDGVAKAVITVDGATRRGKILNFKSIIDKVKGNIPSLEHVVILNHVGLDIEHKLGEYDWDELITGMPEASKTEIMDADDPMMLIYTSGTTGMPKGTVQTHCGFMVKTLLDLNVLSELTSDDRALWMSDMGWVVGPLQILSTSYVGATLIMGEGGPTYPDVGRIWRLIDEYKVTWLGFAPTIARMFMGQDSVRMDEYDLSSLKIVFTTGEAWNPDAWMWLFDNVCRKSVPILNLVGGTEIGCGILSCTVLRPLKPCCFNTEIPGMGADVINDQGVSLSSGVVGELALRNPSIGLTRGLWNNPERYLDSYWRTVPGVWVHGDWAVKDTDGMWYVLGRSDDTLKIAGKRVGPAEIEGPILATGKITEAAAIAIPDKEGNSSVVCVCVPSNDQEDKDRLQTIVADVVTAAMGRAYRPQKIIFVKDLPKTRTLKIMRRVVKSILLGHQPGDLSSLINPEAIDFLKHETIN